MDHGLIGRLLVDLGRNTDMDHVKSKEDGELPLKDVGCAQSSVSGPDGESIWGQDRCKAIFDFERSMIDEVLGC